MSFHRKEGKAEAQQEEEHLLEEVEGHHRGKSVVVPPPADLYQPAAHAEGLLQDDHSQVQSRTLALAMFQTASLLPYLVAYNT